FIDNPDVEEVGIDDVAIRKGQTYATAVYDLKDHHLIALLEGRDAETLTGWLKNHQKIRLVARDRASAYAAAINAVLPDCVQVADRFHLLQNLLEYLKDIFKAEMPSAIYIKDGKILEQAPEKIQREKEPDKKYLSTLHYDNSPPVNPDGSEHSYDNKNHCLSRKQYKDQAENRKKNGS
ncbi:ISL3 family transposase, partial [bacterium 1xD8-6]